MALKKAPQRILQTELRTQEEWERFLAKPGLAVVDAYANWCGPCKAIISLFLKIRNESGDEPLSFATADTDNIASLADYRGKSQPTFLFYGDGQLINVMRGCDGPKMTKLIKSSLKKEKQIAEGLIEREIFIDKVVCKEPELEEKEDLDKEKRDEVEEELVPKEVIISIIKPNVVNAGLADQIIEELSGAGFEILQKEERLLTNEEVAELFKQNEEGDFEQLIEFMTSGPCVVLAISKAGDTVGEEIIAEFATLLGPADINIAKEEAPESLRAKYGTDSLHNAIHCSISGEEAAREFEFFFPDFIKPTAKHLKQQKSLQRTLALIRPKALVRKDSILRTIEDCGFLISMQKEVQFTQEIAEEFYLAKKDEEFYGDLISNMISGPSLVICLTKKDAINVWKEMLAPKEVNTSAEGETTVGEGETPVEGETPQEGEAPVEEEISLNVKFAVPEDTCDPLHGSDTVEEFEREMKLLFPMKNTVVVIKPDTYKNNDEQEAIIRKIKQAGFNIVIHKEVTLNKEKASMLYKDDAEEESFENLMNYMISGPSNFLILSREDAVDGMQALLGPANPEEAKEVDPNSLHARFGTDEIRNAIYGCSNATAVSEIIAEFFPEVELDENGLVIEIVENEILRNETPAVDNTVTSTDAGNAEIENATESAPAVDNTMTSTDADNAEIENAANSAPVVDDTVTPADDGNSETENATVAGEVIGDTGDDAVNVSEPVVAEGNASSTDQHNEELGETADTVEAAQDVGDAAVNNVSETMEDTSLDPAVVGETAGDPAPVESTGSATSKSSTLDGQISSRAASNASVSSNREATLDGATDGDATTEANREPTLDQATDGEATIEVSREPILDETTGGEATSEASVEPTLDETTDGDITTDASREPTDITTDANTSDQTSREPTIDGQIEGATSTEESDAPTPIVTTTSNTETDSAPE